MTKDLLEYSDKEYKTLIQDTENGLLNGFFAVISRLFFQSRLLNKPVKIST